MTGLDVNAFMDKIYYGDEIEFKIADTTYFIQGNFDGKKYRLTVDYWKSDDGTEPEHDYLLSLECDTAEERLQMFEDAKIFNGKNIYEIANSVEVVYG